MISHKHGCIFIHINKCAGTSVEKFFNHKRRGTIHRHALGYRKKYPKKFDKYFTFTFVRNPWDRVVSFYYQQKKHNFKEYPFNNIPFDKFVRNWLKSVGSQCLLSTSSCYDWLTDADDNLIIDFVGRFENLQEDFNIVCDKIGISQPQLPHLNKKPIEISKYKHYTEYYDDETKQIVAEQYAKDIEYYGYEFNKEKL